MIFSGAQNDLERITQMAYQQVAVYGMNENIGLVSFPPRDDQFNKPYSNETAKTIDHEVRTIIDTAYKRCLNLLTEKKDLVEKLALALLDKEVGSLLAGPCGRSHRLSPDLQIPSTIFAASSNSIFVPPSVTIAMWIYFL